MNLSEMAQMMSNATGMDLPASQRPAQRWPLAGGRALPSGAE